MWNLFEMRRIFGTFYYRIRYGKLDINWTGFLAQIKSMKLSIVIENG